MTSRSNRRWSVVGVFLALALASCKDTHTDPGPPDGRPADAAPPARLTIDRTSAQFGSVAVGTTSATMSVTVLNAGGSDSGMISPVLTGTDASQFKVTNQCSYVVPGGTCLISVMFAPTSTGTKSAMVVITATPGGMAVATLDGQGAP